MKLSHCVAVLVVIYLIGVLDATTNARKSQVRYLNSMPQFGKAKFSAFTPQTVVFDLVPQGFLTDYSTLDSQNWNFTTEYTSNVTAKSDATYLDSNTYATVYTCQTGARKLKNKMIYDTARSTGPKVALVRVVNLALFDYSINVYNGSVLMFSSVPYCSASAYQEVPPGQYDFDWTIDTFTFDKRGGRLNQTSTTLSSGKVYTFYSTPSGSLVVADASKKTVRSLRDEEAEDVPAAASDFEKVKTKKINRRSMRQQKAEKVVKAQNI